MPATAWLAILGPILALLGAMFGIWIGHRRWKHEQAESATALYRDNHRAAYLELWDIVEEAHIKMRFSLGGGSSADVSGFLADVNNFMIRRGLYIDGQDRVLVLEYLFWTHEFLRQTAGTPAGRRAIATSIENSAMPAAVNVLDEVRERAEELRQRLKERIREVAGAPPTLRKADTESRPSDELLKQLNQLTAEAESQRARVALRIENEDYRFDDFAFRPSFRRPASPD